MTDDVKSPAQPLVVAVEYTDRSPGNWVASLDVPGFRRFGFPLLLTATFRGYLRFSYIHLQNFEQPHQQQSQVHRIRDSHRFTDVET